MQEFEKEFCSQSETDWKSLLQTIESELLGEQYSRNGEELHRLSTNSAERNVHPLFKPHERGSVNPEPTWYHPESTIRAAENPEIIIWILAWADMNSFPTQVRSKWAPRDPAPPLSSKGTPVMVSQP